MNIVRLGVLGATRGVEIVERSLFDGVKVTVICDYYKPVLDTAYQKCKKAGEEVVCTDSFDRLLADDVDAILLANFANEHAPYAIKALNAGKHVISEVVPVQNMAEAVALVEAVEKSGKVYAYSEQYCYFDNVFQMRLLYDRGLIGDLTYAEGDFVNECSPRWPRLTRGDRNHWRNYVQSTFYCTHSIGPMLYITGKRPYKVIGAEIAPQQYMTEVGARSGSAAIEVMTTKDGAVLKSKHGNLRRPWLAYYEIIGTKGMLESDKHAHNIWKFIATKSCVDYKMEKVMPEDFEEIKPYKIKGETPEKCALRCFIGAINNDPIAKKYTIDVYKAIDMCLPGIFSYISILEGKTMEIPDIKDINTREMYRNDYRCTNPNVPEDQRLPSYSLGTVEIDDSVYEKVHERFLKGEGD